MAGGGGSSGGGGGYYRPPVQPIVPDVEPVPQANIQAAQGPAFGPTATPNPFVSGNTPDWAQGHFAMPWWGLDPFGQPLSQEQMMYQAPPPPPMQQQAQQPAQQPGITPEQLQQLQYQDYLNGRSAYRANERLTDSLLAGDTDNTTWRPNPGIGGLDPNSYGAVSYDPRREWQQKPESQWNNYDRALANQQKAAMRAAGFNV